MSAEGRIQAIRLLSDGRWHSGEALARALGVSRAAVWKRLQGFAEWGLELQAVRGRGYRLARPLELLDVIAIRKELSAQARDGLASIELFPVLESTNQWLMSQSGNGDTALCLAECQTAGRGRRGRGWQSPFGANLYLSLAWRFRELPAQFGALGLVVGVAVADSLTNLGLRGHGLKWPNDVLWQGRKLAGVLIEHRGEGSGPSRVVVGLGLNVRMSAGQAKDINQPWTTLSEAFVVENLALPGRNALCAGLVNALVRALAIFESQGLAGFAHRWAGYDLAQGQGVTLEHDGARISGVARGIDHEGALLIEVAGQPRRYLSGDLSLRLSGGGRL